MTHPITPPPELVQQWIEETRSHDCIGAYPADLEQCVAARAAQWGADQQLAEDAKWLDHNALNEPHLRITPVGESLKEAMRPKPPSLKEQALVDLDRLLAIIWEELGDFNPPNTIRRALESISD